MNSKELIDKINDISGALVGSNLLSEFKRLLVTDSVLGELFNQEGKKIFINEKPKLNDRHLPLLEMWWGSERQESADTYLDGSIDCRLFLPTQLGEKNSQRLLMRAIIRFIESDHFSEIFTTVPGLIEIGAGINANYNKVYKIKGFEAPVITFTLPFQFDLALFREESPETNFNGYLSDDLIDDFLTTTIKVINEESNEVLTEFKENFNDEE